MRTAADKLARCAARKPPEVLAMADRGRTRPAGGRDVAGRPRHEATRHGRTCPHELRTPPQTGPGGPANSQPAAVDQRWPFCWLLWAVVGVVLFELGGATSAGTAAIRLAPGWLIARGGVGAIACVFAACRTARDQRDVARRIEATPSGAGTLLSDGGRASLAAARAARLPANDRDSRRRGTRPASQLDRCGFSLAAAASRSLASIAALGLLVGVCVGLANRTGAHGAARRFATDARRPARPSLRS